MYIPLSDDKHRFVQKVHSARASGHWERGRNSNPVAMLPYAAVVCNYLINYYHCPLRQNRLMSFSHVIVVT